MAALLDLLSKTRVNNSLVPVAVRHGRFQVACCFAFPFREWTNLCSTNPWWFVCTTVPQAGSAHTGLTDGHSCCQSEPWTDSEPRTAEMDRCWAVKAPCAHSPASLSLQLTLSQPTCVLVEWITRSQLTGLWPVSCPTRNRTFPTEQFVFLSWILVSTATE